jgi:hypothetical protein
VKYYTFLPRFHGLILDGSKCSTIREKPKAKVGERFALRFWTGRPYGSPMGFLGTAICQKVQPIRIAYSDSGRPIHLDGWLLKPDDANAVAVRDGFENGEALMRYFEAAKKFHVEMVLTTWTDFIPHKATA